jgi:catechol 2,3-dioxygenase-like lactoylglutathione lyase family enzyme
MRFSLLCAALSLALGTPAPAAPAEPPHRAFLALRVSDAEASARWYARTFDLALANSFSTAAYEQRILQGDGLIVELVQLKSGMTPAQPAGLGFMKGGYVVPDFDGKVRRWRAAGVTFLGRIIYDDKLKLNAAILKDPDGNMIQVFGRSSGEGR